MVQVFMVLRCFSCETFQVHQVRVGREGGTERERGEGERVCVCDTLSFLTIVNESR